MGAVGDDHPSFKYVIVSKYFMLALKLFTVVFKRSDRSISFERVDVTAIRVVRNTLSLSANASLCRGPRLGRRENESAEGGDAVPLPIVHDVLAFFKLLVLTSCVSFLVS